MKSRNKVRSTLLLFLTLALGACVSTRPPQEPYQLSGKSVIVSLLDQSETDVAARRYRHAAASLERALRIEPRNPVIWSRLARVSLKKGEPHQAIQLASKSNALAPGNQVLRSENWRVIAEAWDQLGDEQRAEDARHKARP